MKWIDRVYSFLKEENILNNTIIVDNGSSDGFADWVSSKNLYGLVYFQKKNLGFGAANNIGIELALEKNAKHILLLNQDAWLEKGSLDLLINAIDQNKHIGIVSPLHYKKSKTELDDNFGDYLSASDLINYFQNQNESKLINTNFVNAAIWMITADTIKQVGGFNPSFYHYGEDNEYCNRLINRGLGIAIVSNAIGIHDRENRIQKHDKKKLINKAYNNSKVHFFNCGHKFPLAFTVLSIIMKKTPFKYNIYIRLLIGFKLLLERKTLILNKKTADFNKTPFLG